MFLYVFIDQWTTDNEVESIQIWVQKSLSSLILMVLLMYACAIEISP